MKSSAVLISLNLDYLYVLHICSNEMFNFRLINDWSSLELIHKTPVEDTPYAIAAYQGRVLIGVGRLLRLYDMGKKKLLRKCENKHLPTCVTSIQALGQRVYVSDVQESVHFVRYKRHENQLIIFADDTNPRYVTTMCLLDYDTVAVADKFGNISVVITFHIVSYLKFEMMVLTC
jgi:splicing factor 3B subunit 3